jgi:hypothetical protein
MVDPDDDPIEEILARSRERAVCFQAWLDHLRAGDPGFAEASLLQPWDMSEWQASVYLLTGCDEVWRALGAAVLAEHSIEPVHHELENPRRPWSSSEDQVMQWAAHFWNVDSRSVDFPWQFEQFYFYRWVAACHLRKQLPPALTVTEGGAR